VVVEEGKDVDAAAPQVRPSWAVASSPAGTPRRVESISAALARLPVRRFGAATFGREVL